MCIRDRARTMKTKIGRHIFVLGLHYLLNACCLLLLGFLHYPLLMPWKCHCCYTMVDTSSLNSNCWKDFQGNMIIATQCSVPTVLASIKDAATIVSPTSLLRLLTESGAYSRAAIIRWRALSIPYWSEILSRNSFIQKVNGSYVSNSFMLMHPS